MCRLFAYAGPPADLSAWLTGDACSLRALACEHGHGWGLAAWSAPRAAALVAKSPVAADKDPDFARAAATRAPAVLAHIRKASAGAIRVANNHPFAVGPWAFAHNGTVYGMDRERELARVDPELLPYLAGDTDSEVAFLLFLTELRARGLDADAPLAAAADALAAVARRLREEYPGGEKPTKLNFLAGNGEGFVATRWIHGLTTRTTREATWIASEPMGPAEGWREVPDGSVLVARAGRVDVRAL